MFPSGMRCTCVMRLLWVTLRGITPPLWPEWVAVHPTFFWRRTLRTRQGVRHGTGWRAILGIPQSTAAISSTPTRNRKKKRHYVVMTLRFSQVSHYGETQSKVRLLFLTAGGFGSMMGHISGSGEWCRRSFMKFCLLFLSICHQFLNSSQYCTDMWFFITGSTVVYS